MPDFVPLGDLGRTVRGSWYSQAPGWVDREDRPGSNALGVPDAQQGIALPSRATLGQWFDVTGPDGRTFRLQQTDIGPGRSTGRGVDISAAAASAMGYTPGTFPTDAGFTVKPAEPGGAGFTWPGQAGPGSTANGRPVTQGGLAGALTALAEAGNRGGGISGLSGLSGPFSAFSPAYGAPAPIQPIQFTPLDQLGARRFGV